jgi:nucleoside 2-deoxyribosyltransferase
VFFSNYWRISDNQVNSEVMPNPRWSEIIAECNRQLIDDSDGSTAVLFLEGFQELEPDSCGVRFFEIIWGS